MLVLVLFFVFVLVLLVFFVGDTNDYNYDSNFP